MKVSINYGLRVGMGLGGGQGRRLKPSERREDFTGSYFRCIHFLPRKPSGRYGPCPTVGRFFTTFIGSERDGRDRRNRPDHDRSDGSGRNEETNREVNGCLRFTPHLSPLTYAPQARFATRPKGVDRKRTGPDAALA